MAPFHLKSLDPKFGTRPYVIPEAASREKAQMTSAPKVVQKWSKYVPEVVHECSKSDPKVVQTCSGSEPK
eukprot:15682125-Heterocapsa_arctica.AAC.1